jgi:hypothetical protein
MYDLLLDQENRTWRTQPQGSKCMPELLLDQENKTWRPHPQGSKCMNYCLSLEVEYVRFYFLDLAITHRF